MARRRAHSAQQVLYSSAERVRIAEVVKQWIDREEAAAVQGTFGGLADATLDARFRG